MKRKVREATKPEKWYRGDQVPMAVIRKYARQVAEHFKPEKIVLFGSYAYGTPHEDSDVDLLVIMPAWNELSKAAQIDIKLDRTFSLDLIVRTPKNLQWRLDERESFHTEIVTRGKVLYEKGKSRVGAKSRKRLSTRVQTRKRV
jgi:uncharacterized protein